MAKPTTLTLFLEELLEVYAELPDKEFKALILAAGKYKLDGAPPDKLPPMASLLFKPLKLTIDRHARVCAERAEAGRLGGLAKQSNRRAAANDDTEEEGSEPF